MSSMPLNWLLRLVSKKEEPLPPIEPKPPKRVRLDNLAVGKKWLVRTVAQRRVLTIERREDGLYLSGYASAFDTTIAASKTAGIEQRKLWWKLRAIGYVEGYKIKEENILITGMPMMFCIDDIYHGE